MLETNGGDAFLRRRIYVAAAIVTVVGLVIAFVRATATTSLSNVAATSVHVTTSTVSAAPIAQSRGVYADATLLRADVATDLARVYIPSGISNVVTMVDPISKRVVGSFRSDGTPQHVVVSHDLRTLWVLNNKGDTVTPINAHTGTVGRPIAVSDPYNMYFTLDGKAAIVVAELHQRLDFRHPTTMALIASLSVPQCRGANHADFSRDGTMMLLSCEYSGTVTKIDITTRRVVGNLTLPTPRGRPVISMVMPDHSTTTSMPQDLRLSPNGKEFLVADMLQGGVYYIDARQFRVTGFIATGRGAHSITPSRDGTKLFVANRGSIHIKGQPHGQGSVSVIATATGRVIATWRIPGGGSPDMGALTADGKELWLSGRFDGEIYVFDSTTGSLTARIAVPPGPHGLTVWPQPGRFSLGHTGNVR